MATTSTARTSLDGNDRRQLRETQPGAGAAPFPALDAAPPASLRAFLARHGPERPAAVFAVVLVAGYLALLAITVAVGLLLVHAILSLGSVRAADEELPSALAAERTDVLDHVSLGASLVGDLPLLPLLVALAAVLLARHRRWRVAAFIVAAGLLELATYRAASLLVHRDRPDVPHLDDLPLSQSYPSGHVAASVAVYGALALLLTTRFGSRRVRIVCWTLAVALPLIVAVARLYRGMHHPLDELAGASMGVGAVLVALVATRAYGEAQRRQAAGHDAEPRARARPDGARA